MRLYMLPTDRVSLQSFQNACTTTQVNVKHLTENQLNDSFCLL